MSKETNFFIYLLERYAEFKGTSADRVLKEWDRLNLTDDIYEMYDRYHCERLENAFEDIDNWMGERETA